MGKAALRVAVQHPSLLLWYIVVVMVCSVGWLFYTVFVELR